MKVARRIARSGINADLRDDLLFVVEFVDGNGLCHSDQAETLPQGRTWDREEDETQEDFKRRVVADMSSERGRDVIFWSPVRPVA
jgi:hypothetical protein